MLTDSHAHFHLKDSVEEILGRAQQENVTTVVAVGGSCDLNKTAVAAAREFPRQVVAAIGFDRDQAEELVNAPLGVDDAIDRLRFNVQQFRTLSLTIAAIGEIGLDYHYHPETADLQKRLLKAQLGLAVELQLPVIIHSRKADDDTLELLSNHRQNWTGQDDRIGVLHCFTGDEAFAKSLVDMGFLISFSGIVTFPGSEKLRQVAAWVPSDRLLVETDCPYLAPVPLRGKRNEPAYVRHTAELLAEVRGSHFEEIARTTTRNAHRLFGLTERPDGED